MNSKIYITAILLVVTSFFTTHSLGSNEPLRVITTLPDIAELAKEVGGPEVSADSLLDGTEDAHYMDASPSFIRKVANADIACIIGLELEAGWIPKVLEKAGKASLQPGGDGYCEVGKKVDALEKPTANIDRSMGDVHPHGNPHFNLSPKAMSQAAEEMAEVLIRSRPEKTEFFTQRLKSFQNKMTRLHKSIHDKVTKRLKGELKKPLVVEYHKEFTYFFETYGLVAGAPIEKLPGVPPSASHLASSALKAKKSKIRLAIGALYISDKHLKRFTEISGVPYKKLPTMVQKNDEKLDSIEELQTYLADQILESM